MRIEFLRGDYPGCDCDLRLMKRKGVLLDRGEAVVMDLDALAKSDIDQSTVREIMLIINVMRRQNKLINN